MDFPSAKADFKKFSQLTSEEKVKCFLTTKWENPGSDDYENMKDDYQQTVNDLLYARKFDTLQALLKILHKSSKNELVAQLIGISTFMICDEFTEFLDYQQELIEKLQQELKMLKK